MTQQQLKVVIFDMDGLMLDTESIYRLAWIQTASEFGFSLDDALYLQFVGRHLDDCKTMLLQVFGDQFPLSSFLRKSLLACRQHIDAYGVSAKPGLLELLDFVAATGLRTAVATSSGRAHAQKCMGELAGRFDVIVTGDDVTRRKPAPDIFEITASRLNVSPPECLVLEDSDAGVEAASAASMRVVMVPDLKPPSPRAVMQASHIVTSLYEVRALLEMSL